MKTVLFLSALMWILMPAAYAQGGVFTTANGRASFFSTAPLEDISAQNDAVSSVINTGNSEVVVRIPVSKFNFSNELMQEHFNDDFLETGKYPAASFTGKINEAVPWSKPGTYDVSATGVLMIHGVSVPRTIKGKLQVGENGLKLESTFLVKLQDHKVNIPKLLFQKIAEQVEVKCFFNYTPYKKPG